MTVSSIGIGTYLGNWDAETDENYTNAVEKFVESGGNVIDTAANYRFQRSERNIGNALQNLSEKGFEREEIVICTKGGYLPFDNEPPTMCAVILKKISLKTGIATLTIWSAEVIVCRRIICRINSINRLQNMQISAVDVYYIHNPESQLSGVDKNTFEARLGKAFEVLEKNRTHRKIAVLRRGDLERFSRLAAGRGLSFARKNG